MRRVILISLAVLVTLAGLLLIWQLRLGVVLFLISLAVAAMLRPATNFWVRRGFKQGFGILLTYFLLLLVLGGLIYLIAGGFLKEVQQATNAFTQTYEKITRTWPQGAPFQQSIARQLPPPQALYGAIAGEQGTQLFQNIFGAASGVFVILGQFLIVLILSIYWTADRIHFERLLLSLLPAGRRIWARGVWRTIEIEVGAYLRSELVQSLLAAILLGLGYWLMGLPYPVSLALIGALLWLIPWVGAVIALILPLLTGLTQSPILGIGAGLYTVFILLVLELVIEPRLFSRKHYSPLLTVILMVALADVIGLVGLLIAPPLAAAIQVFFNTVLRRSTAEAPANPRAQIAILRTRLNAVHQQIESADLALKPELGSLVERLDNLIEEADEALQTNQPVDPPALGLPVQTNGKS
jgi:predicted PurR-regulated permease PerM